MARLPSSKRSLRSYRLSSEEYIQMLTALVLQLIQCMVVLPKQLADKNSNVSSRLYHDKLNLCYVLIFFEFIILF